MSLPGPAISERRAHDRHPFHVTADLMLPGGQVVPAHTLDIGKGGAGIVCDLNVGIGSTVRIRMRLPARPAGSALFESAATVTNTTLAPKDGGFRVGLQFAPLGPESLAVLKGALPM